MYRALVSLVSAQAMANPPNPHAREAMLIHYKYLMRCASNLAITMQPASIILAGDNQVCAWGRCGHRWIVSRGATVGQRALTLPPAR